MLTAAHCNVAAAGGTFRGVSFAPQYTSGSPLLTGTFYADPNFNKSQSDPADVAVVVLDKAVKGVTPARLPTLGVLDSMFANGTLNQSSRFTAVGYGDRAAAARPVSSARTTPCPDSGS